MKRFKLNDIRLDEKEFKTNLGFDNFIFVGSGNDIFAKDIPEEWILKTLNHCNQYINKYLFQTKNPKRVLKYIDYFPLKSIICTTIESNRNYPEIMNNSPSVENRIKYLSEIKKFPRMITIEPILDFDLQKLINMINYCYPFQVNIGSDSKGNKLPEPKKEKLNLLINELKQYSKIFIKDNLKRLLND